MGSEGKELNDTVKYLRKNTKSIVIPCENKHPVRSHKGNVWTWDSVMSYKGWGVTSHYGILLNDIFVLDFDRRSVIEEWEGNFPILKECPKEETKKGAHYYFKRTMKCDELELYDKARALYDNGISIDIDIKTKCKTGTSGLIICAPSPNKKWIRPLSQGLIDIPDDLCNFLAELHVPKPKILELACAPQQNNDLLQYCNRLLREQLNDTTSVCSECNGKNLYYKTFGDRVCPFEHTHKSNNFFLNVDPWGYIRYKCLSSECIHKTQKIIGQYRDDIYQDLFQHPETDDVYSSLIHGLYPDKYKYCSSTNKLYEFNGIRWNQQKDEVFYTAINKRVKHGLKVLLSTLMAEKIELDTNNKQDESKARQMLYKSTLKGYGYVSKQRNKHNIIFGTKILYSNSEFTDLLDANPYIIATNNCIIDLKTQCFIENTDDPKYWVTKSTGYDFFLLSNDYDVNIDDNFEEFIEKIYPVKEEREFAQKWYGYCLLGNSPEKYICFLTDVRGGNNGKSKMSELIRRTMGDYGYVGKNEVLYKAERTDGKNSHDASLLAYRGKRMATFEELDPAKVIDEQWVKRTVGGNAKVTGRALFAKEETTFEFTTKLIVAVNEGNMPKFTLTDKALLSRLLTIPHRSRFCKNADKINEKYTYEVNENIDACFDTWRPYCLAWLLKGLTKYHETGITGTIPVGCNEYLNRIVNENNHVLKFIESHYECTGDNMDYVQLRDIFAMFNIECKDLQRDKRTKIDRVKLEKVLKEHMGEDNYKERFHPNRNKLVRNCFIGWKAKTNHESEFL